MKRDYRRTAGWWRGVLVAATLLSLAGCGSYKLQGVVLEGDSPRVEIVDKNDPRLEQFGVAAARLTVELDPQRLSPEMIGRGQSDGDGRFSLPIDEPGAGLLMMDVRLRVSREDFGSLQQDFELPGRGKRLVITLKPGKDDPSTGDDNLLRDTLREAAPYLRD